MKKKKNEEKEKRQKRESVGKCEWNKTRQANKTSYRKVEKKEKKIRNVFESMSFSLSLS